MERGASQNSLPAPVGSRCQAAGGAGARLQAGSEPPARELARHANSRELGLDDVFEGEGDLAVDGAHGKFEAPLAS